MTGDVRMTEVLDLRDGLRCALEANGETGSAAVCDLLTELLHGGNGADGAVGLRRLKARVYRLDIASGSPWGSVVLKRLEPAVAQRNRLLAECWLPALGLGDRCARLLGEAADRSGDCVWQIYEDLGPDTLAVRLDPERVRATVDLIAELHTRAARHVVLPEARRYAGSLGLPYFIANVRDAIAALEALAESGIEPPREYAPRRAHFFEEAAGPDTLLHGDLWPINVFVVATAQGLRARLVDWDRMGVGPFSYDLSTFLFRFRPAERREILERYRHAVARVGGRVGSPSQLDVLFDTAERARYANGVIWPAHALLQEGAAWGFPQLAEVERWFRSLDSPC
jgi:hypothetical protein